MPCGSNSVVRMVEVPMNAPRVGDIFLSKMDFRPPVIITPQGNMFYTGRGKQMQKGSCEGAELHSYLERSKYELHVNMNDVFSDLSLEILR